VNRAGQLKALVLAGSRPGGDPLAQHVGVSHKALIEVGGRSLIERVVGALAQVPQVERILIAIERPQVLESLPGLHAPKCPKPVTIVPAEATPSGSVGRVLEREGTPLLVTTGDSALLAPDWVQDFLAACPEEADAAVALASMEAVHRCAPDTQRTYLRFADGAYSGCNLFFFQHPRAAHAVRFWTEMEAHRKSPLRMMRRLGLATALRYRLGSLRLQEAVARLETLCGARIRIVELSDGRAAIDVDKLADLELVRALSVSP
jgi:GTP:adenosylcobinamide-phosphate guanylyltransferase